MITPVVLHEDAFYEYFKTYRDPDACHDIWGGLGLETSAKTLIQSENRMSLIWGRCWRVALAMTSGLLPVTILLIAYVTWSQKNLIKGLMSSFVFQVD
jgi:hypothetical protein